MGKKEKEQEPIFVQMFREAEPFYEGRYAASKPYQDLEYEYAYWDIELQKLCKSSELRKIKEKLISLRVSMEVYRDYHYFVQGIDAMLRWLGEKVPPLGAYMEGEEEETEEGPLS